MTRQLISTNKQPLLRSSHAKRPPQNGFVQVGKPEKFVLGPCCGAQSCRMQHGGAYFTANSFSNNSSESLAPSTDNHTDLFFVAGFEM